MEEARKERGRWEGDHIIVLALVRALENLDGQKKADRESISCHGPPPTQQPPQAPSSRLPPRPTS